MSLIRWFVTLLLAPVALVAAAGAQNNTTDVVSRVDHLVYTTPDLQTGVAAVERLLGVRATPGGQHPGLGTRNALVSLGGSAYLEIIGPDPEQPKPAGPRRFGIDALAEPRLFTWVAKSRNLGALVATAKAHGADVGQVLAGSRKRPDGVLLAWRYTDPDVTLGDRLIPYFIDWGTSPHPSLTAAPGAVLTGLRAEHPRAAEVQRILTGLGLPLQVTRGPRPSLVATIRGPKGEVELKN